MKLKLLMTLFSVLLLSGVASAQTGTDSLNVDTLRLEVTSMVDTVTGNDLEVTVELWGYIDGQTLGSIEVGFGWLSSNMQMDSARMSSTALTAFDFLKFLYLSGSLSQTNAALQFQFVGSRIASTGLAPSSSAQLLATYWLTYTNWTSSSSITIDTTKVGNTGFTFVQTTNNSASYVPHWAGAVNLGITDIIVIGGSSGSNSLPQEYALYQNYPNPFNPSTRIEFALPFAGKYTLTIYNILGQVVERIEDEVSSPKKEIVEWDASNQASGVYFYRLEANNFADTKKMMLLK